MGVYARRGSKYWWYLVEGAGIRKSTGIPKAGGSPQQDRELRRQAETIYAAEKAKHALGHTQPTAKPTISYTAFSAWFEQHHTSHQRGAVRAASMLRSLGQYFSRYDNLAAIDEAGVKEWMTWRSNHVAKGTVNRELDVLKSLLRAAVPKYLTASPIAGLRRFRVVEMEPRVLTVEEETRLLAIAAPADLAWLLMGLDTLLRLSNIVFLKWAQVKLDRGVIVPLNAKVSHDNVPISTRLEAALLALPKEGPYVFPAFHAKGTGPTAAKNLAIRRFDALCQMARIPHGRAADGLTFHGLRHTGATRALQGGASVRTVMKLGGWKDERSVMRYVHASDSDVRAAAESIGRPRLPNHSD